MGEGSHSRLQTHQICDHRVGLGARHQEAGHGAHRARFAVRLHQKVTQESLVHVGPGGDLGEGRGGRLHRRRDSLILRHDMADRADFERDLAAVGDLRASCPSAGRRAAKARIRAKAATADLLMASSIDVRGRACAGRDPEAPPSVSRRSECRKAFIILKPRETICGMAVRRPSKRLSPAAPLPTGADQRSATKDRVMTSSIGERMGWMGDLPLDS